MFLRRSGIAGLGVILLCAGCRHAPLVASSALPGPALAAVPQTSSTPSDSYPSAISPSIAAQPAAYAAPAAGPSLSALPTPMEIQPEAISVGEPAAVTDPNAPTWPAPSVAENYCRPSFGEHFRGDAGILWHQTVADYKNFYRWKNLSVLAVGFGVGAIGANTELDQHIRNWYQKSVRSNSSDNVAKVAKMFGEGAYEAPAAVAAWLVGETCYDTRLGDVIGEWGDRELRSLFVGTPALLFMQYATGASRPGETTAESRWKPFTDNNGVSGHAFMGALPFINAAKMTDEVPLKIGFYACSAFAGWSRINDDAHYTSQVFLGWWMAYWTATCIDLTDHQEHSWQITPLPMVDGAGMAITYQY